MEGDGAGGRRSELDIGALLRVALEQKPRDDVQERVMNRVAAAETAAEFVRLLFVAPVQWMGAGGPSEQADDDEGDDDGRASQ